MRRGSLACRQSRLAVYRSSRQQRRCGSGNRGHRLRRIKQAELFHLLEISGDKVAADVLPISYIRDEDLFGERNCALLCGGDGIAGAGHDHGPAIGAAGDELAVVQADLAEMKMPAIRLSECLVE